MLNGRRRWLAAVAVAAVVAVGAGAGVAATGAGGDGFLADVAKRLGITEQKLTNAIRDARLAQVDEAVKAGDLTEQQGERLKERIRSGEGLGLGPGLRGFGHHGPLGHAGRGADVLGAAAEYLDMTAAELREALADEGTLADVARAEGKSVDGLKAAIRKAIQDDLDQAVEDGVVTEAQAERLAEHLGERVDDMVDEGFGFRGRGMHRRGGPFGAFGPNASFDVVVGAPGAGVF